MTATWDTWQPVVIRAKKQTLDDPALAEAVAMVRAGAHLVFVEGPRGWLADVGRYDDKILSRTRKGEFVQPMATVQLP